MPPAYERELYFKYGTLEVGGNTEYHPHEWHHVRKAFDSGEFEVKFAVARSGMTEAEFAARCTAIESAARKPFQDLVVKQGTATLLSLKHSTNTALNTQPEIEKPGGELDTGRSRLYVFRLSYDLPADNAPTVGLRESGVAVKYLPSRRRHVTITGVWTANSGSDAMTAYDAGIAAYSTAALTALTGTYDKIEEDADHDYENKIVNFRQLYKERVADEGSSGTLNATNIKDQVLTMRRREEGPGDYVAEVEQVNRLVMLDVRYDCWIDKTLSTDLRGEWENIRGWVVEQVNALLAGGAVAITLEDFDENVDDNKFTVNLVCLGLSGGGMITNAVSIATQIDFGRVRVGIWDSEPISKYEYQGHATVMRSISQRFRVGSFLTEKQAAKHLLPPGTQGRPHLAPLGGTGSWSEESRVIRTSPLKIGVSDFGDPFFITDVEIDATYEYVKLKRSGAHSASSTGTGAGGRQVPRAITR